MLRWLVVLVGGVAALAMGLEPIGGDTFLCYALAVLAAVFGTVIWIAGKLFHRRFQAVALSVVAVGVIQLLAIPLGLGVRHWEDEQYRRSRPWNALLDSALAIQPAAEIPGTYSFATCVEPCEPDDTTRATMLAELTLLPGPFETADGHAVPNACLRYWRTRVRSKGLTDEVTPKRWTQNRNGAVDLADLELSCVEGCSKEIVVTREGIIGLSTFGDYLENASYLFISGRRIGPPDESACLVD